MSNSAIKAPFYEPFLAQHFPAWHARREDARLHAQASMSYRGAIQTRLGTPWTSSNTSFRGGKSADRADYRTMRDRARRAYQQNVIAQALLDTETDNIAPAAFSLQMQSSSAEFNKETEARFYRWLDKADVRGMLTADEWFRTSWREPRKDGDGGIVLIKRGGYPKLQYVPGDLVVNPVGRYDWNIVKDGVEHDGAGRPVAFHVRDVDENGKDTTSRIPANDFVWLAPKLDPLGLRARTVYAPVFRELDGLDEYKDAVIAAARLGAMFGLIHRVNKPGQMLGGLGTGTNSAGDQQKLVTLENGMIRVEGTAESTYQVQAQQPMAQTPDFIRACFRIVALAFDMPLEIGMRDLSQVNFSGGRIGLIAYYRSCQAKQEWLKARCWNRIVFWWLSVERQRKELGYDDAFVNAFPADYGTFELHGAEWAYTDPVSEAQADLLEISMGIKAPQQACEVRGRDWAETQNQIEAARKVRSDKSIPNVLSSLTRDETVKTTAIDAEGKPIIGATPLNGAQITAAIDVMTKAREGAMSDDAAAELLAQVGIPKDRATVMVKSLQKLTVGSGDVAFKREMLKQLLAVPAAREAVYNATDIEDLVAETGLSPEKGYEAPWIPVKAAPGELVSGAVIRDPEGDVVGGDVENVLPAESPTDSGGARNGGNDNNDDDPSDGEQDESD